MLLIHIIIIVKKFLLVSFFVLFFVFFTAALFKVGADELEDINTSLKKLQTEFQGKDANYQKLNLELAAIKNQVVEIEKQVVKKEEEVAHGTVVLSYQRKLLFERTKSYYKSFSQSSLSLIDVVVGENFSETLKNFFYQKTAVDEDKRTIIKIALYIKDLEDKKARLEREKTQLVVVKKNIDDQTQALANQLTTIKKQIATLTARQQQLVAQRLASLNIPRSAGTSSRGCTDDRGVDPGFSPRFAFFTYGAPHRNGLNQYGAWGRAKAGQNEEQMLAEYYPNMSLKKDYDRGVQVSVEGFGNFNIEDYVKRIYEMPDSWTDNNLAALKAQAVAARSYALNTVQRHGSICTTEACQVFKPESKGGNWETAVNATAGWVLMDGGNPGFTQYASTHGGYILNLGKFDGKDGRPSSFSELNDRAYDRESPWFYCDWGARQGYSNTAWLKSSELADITNVILLAKIDSGTGDHLYQQDKPHPYGGEVWGEDRVRSELKNRGVTAFTNVSDVSIGADFGSGKTNSINIAGDGGSVSFSGEELKNWFNLRAPANIQIVGPLYNIEKR